MSAAERSEAEAHIANVQKNDGAGNTLLDNKAYYEANKDSMDEATRGVHEAHIAHEEKQIRTRQEQEQKREETHRERLADLKSYIAANKTITSPEALAAAEDHLAAVERTRATKETLLDNQAHYAARSATMTAIHRQQLASHIAYQERQASYAAKHAKRTPSAEENAEAQGHLAAISALNKEQGQVREVQAYYEEHKKTMLAEEGRRLDQHIAALEAKLALTRETAELWDYRADKRASLSEKELKDVKEQIAQLNMRAHGHQVRQSKSQLVDLQAHLEANGATLSEQEQRQLKAQIANMERGHQAQLTHYRETHGAIISEDERAKVDASIALSAYNQELAHIDELEAYHAAHKDSLPAEELGRFEVHLQAAEKKLAISKELLRLRTYRAEHRDWNGANLSDAEREAVERQIAEHEMRAHAHDVELHKDQLVDHRAHYEANKDKMSEQDRARNRTHIAQLEQQHLTQLKSYLETHEDAISTDERAKVDASIALSEYSQQEQRVEEMRAYLENHKEQLPAVELKKMERLVETNVQKRVVFQKILELSDQRVAEGESDSYKFELAFLKMRAHAHDVDHGRNELLALRAHYEAHKNTTMSAQERKTTVDHIDQIEAKHLEELKHYYNEHRETMADEERVELDAKIDALERTRLQERREYLEEGKEISAAEKQQVESHIELLEKEIEAHAARADTFARRNEWSWYWIALLAMLVFDVLALLYYFLWERKAAVVDPNKEHLV